MMMNIEQKRTFLIVRASALISAMYALLLARLRLLRCERPQISYGPMSLRDEERQRNLNLIYNYNDIVCVNMLRMRRAPFLVCATCLGTENFFPTTLILVLKSKLLCFSTLLVITNDLELSRTTGEGQ